MIRIKSFAKSKGETGVGGYIINTSTTSTPSSLDLHYFWGQPYDGTQDVDGDLVTNGNISASSVNADSATVNTLSASSATVDSLSADTTVTNTLSASSATVDSLSADTTVTNTLSASSISAISGNIQSLLSGDIRVDNLTVTQAAHFFKLIIDEVRSTQGQIIITPANAELVFVVNIYSNVWRCYFRAVDADGKEISNGFTADDLVVCQTFNATSGETHDASNRFYWAKIIRVASFVKFTVEGQQTLCHTVDIDMSVAAPNSNARPRKGDSIVQLGNLTDTTRQSAIIISSYNNQFLDSTIEAPSIVQYNGISYFNLSAHRLNVISKSMNSFNGNFTTTAGDDVANTLSEIKQTTSSITSTVTALQGDVSEIKQTTSSITSTVTALQGDVDTLEGDVDELSGTKQLIDLTDCSESSFYPIGIAFKGSSSDEVRCQVKRTLDSSYGVPSYSNNQSGFVVLLDWQTKIGAWGTNPVNEQWSSTDDTRYINYYTVNWTLNDDKNICGSIGQDIRGSVEIVYARGGSKYDVSTSRPSSTITAYKQGYTAEYRESGRPITVTFPVITTLLLPIQDTMIKSQITQTAENIKLEVISGLTNTGIDIAQGTINLQADKVTFSDSQGGNTDKIVIDPTTGTLSATNGTFVDSTVRGQLTANMLYVPTTELLGTSDYTIELSKDSPSSFTVITYPQVGNKHITLPRAINYNGIELTFLYLKQQNDGNASVIVRIDPNDTVSQICFRPYLTMTYGDIVYEVPYIGTGVSAARQVYIFYNQRITFKAVGNTWYVVEGRVGDAGNN